MTIPTEIYEKLSPTERVRAAVLANARDDRQELQILKDTCPKKSYLMTDPAYAETMERLMSLLIALELDLANCALNFEMARIYDAPIHFELQQSALEDTACIVEAFNQLVAELELDADAMAKNAPPRHPMVTATITVSDGEADPDKVEERLATMRAYLSA